MKFIGAHVSIAGGVENAPLNAHAIGATAFALFTKNQRQWSAPPVTESAAAVFCANCARFGYTSAAILPHDTYLINLCQPDLEKRAAAQKAFAAELERCRALGLDRLNFHPGSHLGKLTVKAACDAVAESVRIALDTVPGVTAVFENTAGQGTNLGHTFGELADMLEAVGRPDRVGVCIDTCHAYAAGYDIKGPEGFDQTFAEFDRLIGFKYLRGMHLNDSKSVLGGRLDRHHSLGEGELGWPVFERIMRDSRFDNIPLVLETIDEAKWPTEIARLQAWAKGQ